MERIRNALKALDLGLDATPEQIKDAYRDLVKVWHPDHFPSGSRLQQRAQEKLKAINDAYEVLRTAGPGLRSGETPGVRTQAPPREADDPPRRPARRKRRRENPTFRLDQWVFAGAILTMAAVAIYSINRLDEVVKPWRELVGEVDDRSKAVADLKRAQPGATPRQAHAQSSAPQKKDEGTLSISVRTRSDSGSGNLRGEARANPGLRQASDSGRQFTVGSSKSEVLVIQGDPDKQNREAWSYGPSRVFFEDGRVTRWESDPSHPLEARRPTAAAAAVSARTFRVGSTKAEVMAIQGAPTKMADREWRFGRSRVYFEGGRVSRWEQAPGDSLRVSS